MTLKGRLEARPHNQKLIEAVVVLGEWVEVWATLKLGPGPAYVGHRI